MGMNPCEEHGPRANFFARGMIDHLLDIQFQATHFNHLHHTPQEYRLHFVANNLQGNVEQNPEFHHLNANTKVHWELEIRYRISVRNSVSGDSGFSSQYCSNWGSGKNPGGFYSAVWTPIVARGRVVGTRHDRVSVHMKFAYSTMLSFFLPCHVINMDFIQTLCS